MTKDSCELLARIGTALYDPDVLTRQDADALYTALDALVAEVERLREQRRIDHAEAARVYDFARDKGKALERVAVVAWLRGGARNHRGFGVRLIGDELEKYADSIERGEHRREEEK